MQFGWRIGEQESFHVMDKAVELGINCLDTADIYSYWAKNGYPGKTEEIIDRWPKERRVRESQPLPILLEVKMSRKDTSQIRGSESWIL